MSWWANKLAPSATPAPAAPAPQAQTWWAPQPQQFQPHTPQQPQQSVPQQPQAPTRAVSARPGATGYCPECGGSEYYTPTGTQSMPKCFECGYNPRFTQQAAGGGIQGEDVGPTRPAKQVSTANNFNPGTFVGKIG